MSATDESTALIDARQQSHHIWAPTETAVFPGGDRSDRQLEVHSASSEDAEIWDRLENRRRSAHYYMHEYFDCLGLVSVPGHAESRPAEASQGKYMDGDGLDRDFMLMAVSGKTCR